MRTQLFALVAQLNAAWPGKIVVMASAPQAAAPATNPITGTLPLPPDPDARVDLPHLTCEPVLGVSELAVLYAAGHHEATRRALEQLCEASQGDGVPWIMLLELHRALGDQERFNATLAGHRARFPNAAEPLWCMPPLPPSSNTMQLNGVFSEPELEAVMSHAQVRRVVVLDFSDVARIAFSVAPAFCSALRLMTLQNKRVIIANIAELHSCLLRTIGLHSAVAVLARQVNGPSGISSNDPLALAAA